MSRPHRTGARAAGPVQIATAWVGSIGGRRQDLDLRVAAARWAPRQGSLGLPQRVKARIAGGNGSNPVPATNQRP